MGFIGGDLKKPLYCLKSLQLVAFPGESAVGIRGKELIGTAESVQRVDPCGPS